jgi:DNA-binding MarR family transcriptional regulator
MHALVEDPFYDRLTAPVTLLFGDDAPRRWRIARMVAERGGRLAGHVAIAAAAARLEVQAVAHLVIIDAVGGEPGETALDVLLDRVGEGLVARRFEALVLLPAALIERAGPLLGREGVELLLEPDDREIASALDGLLAPSTPGVAEDREEERRLKLAELGEEVARIARALTAMAAEGAPGTPPAAIADPAEEVDFLRRHIRLRRLRDQYFDAGLFADPGWDILLDLRLAAIEGRRVSVSSLCIAAAVPPTTGLRWIASMTRQGLLVRIADPEDGRRVHVALGVEADAAMARYVAAALVAR